MYKKAVLIIFGILVVCSAIYALMDRRDVTTSSDKAYKAYEKGLDYSNKLYFKESLQEFERAVKLDPQFAMAHLRAAGLYWEFDRKEKYKEASKRALALIDKVKDIERIQILLGTAEMERNKEDTEKYSAELLDKYPDHFDAIHFISKKYFGEGKYEEAIDANLRLLKIDPGFALAHNQLGYIYYFLGEYDKSLESLKKYAEIAEGQANPHDSQGEILMYLGRYAEALEQFQIADSIKPNLFFVVSHIGDCYASTGLHRDAIGAYMKAGELARNDKYLIEQKIKIASCYYYMDKLPDAVAILEEEVENAADNLYLQAELGGYYVHSGNIDKALVQLGIVKGLTAKSSSKETYPDSVHKTPPVQLALEAKIATERGNYDVAIASYKQILEQLKEFNTLSTKRRLADVYTKAEMPDTAIVIFNSILRRNPNDALCLLRLADAYGASGLKNEQKETLQRFLTVVKDADENAWFVREALEAIRQIENAIS